MVKGKRNGLTFTECSVKICRILLLSPPCWKWSYHNATQSECSHRLGWEGSASFLDQPQSKVKQNQCTPGLLLKLTWKFLNFSVKVYADFGQLITFPKWSKISRRPSFWFHRIYLWRNRTTGNFLLFIYFFFHIRITLSWSINDPESFGPKTQAQNWDNK